MREDDAIAQGKRIYTSNRGWGVSSDGKGGIGAWHRDRARRRHRVEALSTAPATPIPDHEHAEGPVAVSVAGSSGSGCGAVEGVAPGLS